MKTNHKRAGAKLTRTAQFKQARKTASEKPKPARASASRVRIKVPMPPALAQAVETAAHQLGISRDELFARAIEAQLKPGPKSGVTREVVQQLEDARNMRFAVDLLMEAALDQPEALALPTGFVCGVQEIDWHLHFQLGAALGALSPAHAEPASEGHSTTCCARSAIDTLLHLLSVFVIKENNLGSGREKDSLACGLVNLTSWASARLERSVRAGADQRWAMRQLLQRLAAGEDVDRADFVAVGITPAKGG